MKTYYRLIDDVNLSGRWHLGEVAVQDTPEFNTFEGGELPSDLRAVAEIARHGRALAFCLTSFAVPVASTALGRAVCSVAGREVQQIPTCIGGDSGFVVLHAKNLYDCLDESRSEFVKWTASDHRSDLAGHYRMVTSLSIDSSRVPSDAQVFRIARWSIALIVSERVKRAMEFAGCLGAKFQKVI
ncbi:MAG: hypothetical protein K8F56_10165 [Rhodocyclaceae bacterium]|nr:hypothetical protein [Rhodocyclaceae bacterium]